MTSVYLNDSQDRRELLPLLTSHCGHWISAAGAIVRHKLALSEANGTCQEYSTDPAVRHDSVAPFFLH